MTESLSRRDVLKAGAACLAVSRSPLPSMQAGAARRLSKIAFGSCLHSPVETAILDTISGTRPDLFIWLGDNIYADTVDPAIMQARYQQLGANRRFQKLGEGCPQLAIWDDHDYGADNAGAEYPMKKESQKLFLDFWKIPAGDPRRQREGIYHSVTLGPKGQAVQVLLLDNRYFRQRPRVKGATLLGEAQWKWLEEQFRQPASLRLICSGIQVVPETSYECWAEFPEERERLFRLIKSLRIPGVLFLSGDMHYSELSREADVLGYPAYDFTSSGLDQTFPPCANPKRVGDAVDGHSFATISVDWSKDPQLRMEIVDAKGVARLNHRCALGELSPKK